MTDRLPRSVTWALVALAVVLGSGCMGPPSGTTDYEAQLAQPAADAVSSGRTMVVAVDTYRRGMLTRAALVVLLQDSADTVASAVKSFRSIPPPAAPGAAAVRGRLDPLMSTAEHQAAALVRAARRHDTAALTPPRDALARACTGLATFERSAPS